jgi:serine/threonine protein kinase
MADRIGQHLGNYHLLRALGYGAFATVYLGKHQYLERLAAIKVLRVRMEPITHESFRREARTIAQLRHPHIIGVHDFGFENQTPYLVMEYMHSGTLRERFPKRTRLPLEQIVVYVKQIASALDYAHEQHVIHRDVKPENLLLGTNHKAVLSDFGIAVVEHTLASLSIQNPAGTPIYMAPEQIQHKPCTASDQYALGVIVYEWLCGEPPFHGSLFEVFSQHLHKPPPSLRTHLPQLSPAVEDVVFRVLTKDPQHRFRTVQEFAMALEDASLATQPLSLSRAFEHEGQKEIKHLPGHTRLVPVPSASGQDYSDNATQPLLKTTQRIEYQQELHVYDEQAVHKVVAPEIINTHEAIRLFHKLMQADARKRIFCLIGGAKMGKSYLLTQILLPLAKRDYHARCALLNLSHEFYTVPDVLSEACKQLGDQDFHAYYTREQEWMSRPKLDLKGLAATFSHRNISNKDNQDQTRYEARYLTTHFIEDISRLTDQPILLLFDSVEKASSVMKWWLMNNLLISTSRLEHIRVLIAGRFLPEIHAYCQELRQSCTLLPIKEVEEFVTYCQRSNIALSKEQIHALAHAFKYVPGTFVDVLPRFTHTGWADG